MIRLTLAALLGLGLLSPILGMATSVSDSTSKKRQQTITSGTLKREKIDVPWYSKKMAWKLYEEGAEGSWILDFSANPKLLEQAKQIRGQRVLVTGDRLLNGTIRVTSIQPEIICPLTPPPPTGGPQPIASSYFGTLKKQTIHVMGMPPSIFEYWELHVTKVDPLTARRTLKIDRLDLDKNAELLKAAEIYKDHEVQVTAKRTMDGRLRVSRLVITDLRRLINEPVRKLDPTSLVGLAEDEAQLRARLAGFRVRIVDRDGVHFTVTDDLRFDRINLSIEDAKVIKATIG